MATNDRVILHNTNREFAREVFSADGDSTHIMAGAKQPVDKKFLWSLPKDVVEYKSSETVFKKNNDPKVKNTTNKTGNTQNVEDDRKTVATDAATAKKTL